MKFFSQTIFIAFFVINSVFSQISWNIEVTDHEEGYRTQNMIRSHDGQFYYVLLSINYNNPSVPPPSNTHAYRVRKYDILGNIIWDSSPDIGQFGGTSWGFTLDSNGNIVIIGNIILIEGGRQYPVFLNLNKSNGELIHYNTYPEYENTSLILFGDIKTNGLDEFLVESYQYLFSQDDLLLNSTLYKLDLTGNIIDSTDLDIADFTYSSDGKVFSNDWHGTNNPLDFIEHSSIDLSIVNNDTTYQNENRYNLYPDPTGGLFCINPSEGILRLNSDLEMIWDLPSEHFESFNGVELSINYLSEIISLSDGSFLITTVGDDIQFIIKIDDLGNVFWHRNFSNTPISAIYDIAETSDGGYIMLVGINQELSTWLIKLDSNGYLLSDENVFNNETKINVYPNPFNDYIAIDWSNEIRVDERKLTIYDALGKVMLTKNIYQSNEVIQLEEIPSGNYILRIVNDNYENYMRIVKK